MANTQSIRRFIAREISAPSILRTSNPKAGMLSRRAISSSPISRLGNPPPMSTPPFKEPAGRNPAQAYTEISESLHDYGAYLTSCIPKYIQQFSSTHLLSIQYASRIRVKDLCDEISPVRVFLISSEVLIGLNVKYTICWRFSNHPDLRRILTDYGSKAIPYARFSLTDTLKSDTMKKKRVVYEPLQLSQAFRNFEGANSPWEQTGKGADPRPESFQVTRSQTPESSEKSKTT
ncbi:hypothetical protein PSTT_09757 [Puccinia striiformis]|uniref:NADH:ubiquinone oxidoreductase 30kDa subunit domain-containing protein n=1 Tax=Puccinia striiformis TaxID=27350 RepID=A0A2S4V6X9_9BASI|nr:hypothetical protein PSTT_09757 [Puccinia striiformis]